MCVTYRHIPNTSTSRLNPFAKIKGLLLCKEWKHVIGDKKRNYFLTDNKYFLIIHLSQKEVHHVEFIHHVHVNSKMKQLICFVETSIKFIYFFIQIFHPYRSRNIKFDVNLICRNMFRCTFLHSKMINFSMKYDFN